MSQFVEASPLNRDIISSTTPLISAFKSQFYSHQRSHSNQLTYTTIPQPVQTSKFSQQKLIQSFSMPKKDDPEPMNFQTPNSYKQTKVIDKSQEEQPSEMSQKNRSQTRTSRIYTIEDLTQDKNAKQDATANKQTDSSNTKHNIISNKAGVSTITAATSPLLQQFLNMDLRKRASIMPIKPIEINFQKQIETKLGDKFRNLKVEDKLDISDEEKNDSEMESPIEMKIKAKISFMDYNDEHQELEKHASDDEDDEEDTEEDTIDGSEIDNIVVEVKSAKYLSLKSILKKPATLLSSSSSIKNAIEGESKGSQNNNLKQSNNNLNHYRSNSLSSLPSSFNLQSFLGQNTAALTEKYLSPQRHSAKDSNILGNRDMNQMYIDTYSHQRDYQFTSLATPLIEKTRPQLHRSQSLTKIIKKVSFSIQTADNNHNDDDQLFQSNQQFTNQPSSSSSLYKPLALTTNSQKNAKSNQFNKFYSAFKQNLTNSKSSELFSSPQEKINFNNNNSISSTVSTIPSMSSISQISLINNPNLPYSNSSSASSTPLASQSSFSNIISPPQQNFDKKNPSSSAFLQSVFKDMKLTKSTKVYLNQKMINTPSSTFQYKSHPINFMNNSPLNTFQNI